MKPALTGLLIFAAGAGGSAGLYVWKGPKPIVTVVADSTARSHEGEDSTQARLEKPAGAPNAVVPEGSKATVISAAPLLAPDSARDSSAAATPTLALPVGPPPATAADSLRAVKQLGKILTSMKPADAAKIVEHMSDEQVEEIVRTLPVKVTAALLSKLPVERAAALSRRLLAPVAGDTP